VYCNFAEEAALDEPSWKGAQLAVAEFNKSGGIHGEKVELIRIKGNSSVSELKENIAAFLKGSQVMGIVGLLDSDLAQALARQATKQGIPFVTSGATSPKLSGSVGTGFYMACFGDNDQALFLAFRFLATCPMTPAAVWTCLLFSSRH
jgi:branched-chain amino acid transport system substrate-binding protein